MFTFYIPFAPPYFVMLNPSYLARLLVGFVFYTGLIIAFFAIGNQGADLNAWLTQALLVSAGSFVVIVFVMNFATFATPSGRLYSKGREQMRVGNYFNAATLFDQAVRQNPARAELYYGRAEARARLGDTHGALTDYAATIDATPIYLPLSPSVAYDAYLARASIYGQQLGDYHSAIHEAGEAVAMYPNKPLAYLTRADAYAHSNNLPAALTDLDVAAKLTPNDAVIYNNRGYVQYLRGDLQAAGRDLLTSVTMNPTMWQPHYHLAQVYAAQGDRNRALASLRRAIELSPQPATQARLDAAFAGLRGDAEFTQLTSPQGR